MGTVVYGQIDTIKKEKWNIKTNPLQFVMGEARFLGEKRLTQYQAIELIASYYLNYSYIEEHGIYPKFSNRNGFKAGISYKFYSWNNWYLNPLFFYTYLNYSGATTVSVDGFYYGEWHEKMANQKYDFSKQNYTVAFLAGKRFLVSNNFFIEAYLGVGYRYKKINITDCHCDVPFPSPYDCTGNLYSDNNSSKTASFHENLPTIQMGFNVGFRKTKLQQVKAN